jgi:hypothetical protein
MWQSRVSVIETGARYCPASHRHCQHFQEESGNILVDALTVDLNGGDLKIGTHMKTGRCLVIVAAVVLLLTSSCTGLSITSLEAEVEWIAPLGSIGLTCIASGSDLSYEWSTSGGTIAGTGTVVDWVAPEEVGMYDITVNVTGGEGGQDTASISLIASVGPPPGIEDLIVTADHKYLKESAEGYKVGKAQNYSIECVASSNTSGNLTYEWSCTGGEIEGGGSVINWAAPDAVITLTVTAKVFDALGNWVRRSVILEVVACSECTFG